MSPVASATFDELDYHHAGATEGVVTLIGAWTWRIGAPDGRSSRAVPRPSPSLPDSQLIARRRCQKSEHAALAVGRRRDARRAANRRSAGPHVRQPPQQQRL